MKKILIGLLSLLFIFTLIACGDAYVENPTEDTSTVEETTKEVEQVSREWENVLISARSYISFTAFSHESLAN